MPIADTQMSLPVCSQSSPSYSRILLLWLCPFHPSYHLDLVQRWSGLVDLPKVASGCWGSACLVAWGSFWPTGADPAVADPSALALPLPFLTFRFFAFGTSGTGTSPCPPESTWTWSAPSWSFLVTPGSSEFWRFLAWAFLQELEGESALSRFNLEPLLMLARRFLVEWGVSTCRESWSPFSVPGGSSGKVVRSSVRNSLWGLWSSVRDRCFRCLLNLLSRVFLLPSPSPPSRLTLATSAFRRSSATSPSPTFASTFASTSSLPLFLFFLLLPIQPEAPGHDLL